MITFRRQPVGANPVAAICLPRSGHDQQRSQLRIRQLLRMYRRRQRNRQLREFADGPRRLRRLRQAWKAGLIQLLPMLLAPAIVSADGEEEREWLKGIATSTKSALQQLSLQAKLLESSLTPNSALLKFGGSASMTVDQVLRKRSELLTTFGLNVISVRPEPGAVVIAIERRSRQLIGVESLWKRWHPDAADVGQPGTTDRRTRERRHIAVSIAGPPACAPHSHRRHHG